MSWAGARGTSAVTLVQEGSFADNYAYNFGSLVWALS